MVASVKVTLYARNPAHNPRGIEDIAILVDEELGLVTLQLREVLAEVDLEVLLRGV